VVARTLQLLGATITVEEKAETDGRRLDFHAEFVDGAVRVEAVSPIVDGWAGDVVRLQQPLINMIRKAAPAGWRIGVYSLPNFGPNQSKQAFRDVVARVLNVPPPQHDSQTIEIREDFPTGTLDLQLRSGGPGDDPISVGPPVVGFDDSVTRIRAAYQRKKKQAKHASLPVLLAINGTSPIVDNFDAFDRALIGTRVTAINSLGQQAYRFDVDGEFGNRPFSREDPTFAGVLAFVRVLESSVPDPALFPHIRFNKRLPWGLTQLEAHSYDPNVGIVVTSARRTVLSALSFPEPAE
jgi:hypothetical protein